MCGIVAVFSNGRPVSANSLRRATQALHHRGPDGQRQWIAPHGRVGMGHARLSIIDLATGDQPIANEDERIHDRRQRRVLRLRALPEGARAARPPPAHALGQRDPGPPLRGARHALPARAARRVRLRALGRAQRAALRRARPLRHQAALLRAGRRHALPRLRDQGAASPPACRRAGITSRCIQTCT